MASRIEQIIEEIEEYIDGCKYQALSSSKIIVNKDELEELLNELRYFGRRTGKSGCNYCKSPGENG